MISDSECQLRMPKGEGFRVEEAPTPRYLADAMKNIGVESRRQAPTSAWFSLMGLHSIIGSITVYRSECASSRSEPYLPNPVLTSLLRRLDTWYAGLDPSVRLMDRQSIILGSAAIGADASLTESPRSTVVLIHGLIIYHAAEGQLTAPPGHKITAAWEESESAERWRQSCLRTGCVVRLMLSAGEESKLSTPFHIFNVYIVSFYHVVWLLHLKSRLNGRWRAAVLGSLVTFVVQNQSSDALLNNAGEQGNAFSSSQIEEFSSVPGVSEGNVGKGSATDVVEPPEPVDDEQNRLWNEVFNVITSLQFLLQALSPLGTRPRVKALALRSRRMLVRLLEEKEPLGSTNQFGTILLAEGGGDEDKEGA